MFRRNEINQKQVPNVLDFCVAQFREAIILKKVANMGLGGGVGGVLVNFIYFIQTFWSSKLPIYDDVNTLIFEGHLFWE